MKLGLSSYTYGWAVGVRGHEPPQRLDEHRLLDKCREHGVSLLQIGDNLPLHAFDATRLSRLAERATKDGIELEIGARGLTPKRVVEYASIARRIDAKLIRFVIDDANYRPTPETVISILREAASQLDGLILGIENHDRFPSVTLSSMIEAVGSERIGVCLDTANSLGCGEGLETVVNILAPSTVNLHIKDFVIERVPHLMGFTVNGRPAGQGMLDIPKLLRQFAPHSQRTPKHDTRILTAILELWTPPESTIEETIAKEARWAKQSLDYLKPLFSSTIVAS